MTIDSHPSDLIEILALSWQLLEQGCKDRRSGFHHPVLATVGRDGNPKSRVVILREADRLQKMLRCNCDIRTQKWGEIAHHPAVSLTFYDEIEKTQLRVEGTASRHTGDPVAQQAWDNSQRMSRVGYGAQPGPGVVISNPENFVLPQTDGEIAEGIANFGTIIVHITSIEWLYLKVRGNRRVLFDLGADTAQWLVP
jgi:pyridoxamine 5'-phosphate oxidase